MKVPVYKSSQSLQTQRTPTVPISGSPTIAAQGKLAGAVGDVADLFAAREEQRQGENDQIAASNSYFGKGGFLDQARIISQEATGKIGAEAEGVGVGFITAYDGLGEEFLNKFENDNIKLHFKKLFHRGREGDVNIVARHDAAQQQIKKKAAAIARVDASIMQVTENPAQLDVALANVREVLAGHPVELAAAEKTLRETAKESQEQAIWDNGWAAAMGQPTVDDAMDSIELLKLDRTQKEKLKSSVRTQYNINEAAKEKKLKEDQDAVDREFAIGDPSEREIKTSILTVPRIEHYLNRRKSRAKAIEDGKVDPATVNDPSYKASMQSLIRTNPGAVDRIKDIDDRVALGKDGGLTGADAKGLHEDLDEALVNTDRNEELATVETGLLKLRNQQVWAKDDTDDEIAKNEIEYIKKQNALRKWAKENPDGKPVEWFEGNIKTPAEKDWWDNLLQSKLLFGTPILGPFGFTRKGLESLGESLEPDAEPSLSKALTSQQAQAFLQEAKGDKAKARQLAKDAGFEF